MIDARVEDWVRLLDQPGLIEAAARAEGTVAEVAALRRGHDAVLVGLAIELAAARRKARVKWPGRDEIVADVAGVEMATSALAGGHKARRFEGLGLGVMDLCCGIGGDAMALRGRGLDVVGVDASAVRAWMCGRNAGCETRVADVAGVIDDGSAYHLDPARRTSAGRRVWRYEALTPGPEVIERLAEGTGAVKLGPGVDVGVVPPGEVEFISERGSLTQCVLWTGELAGAARRATVLGDEACSIAGDPARIVVGAARGYVLAVDASVERAGLMGNLSESLGAPALHPKVGLLTSDEVVESAFVTVFRLEARMGWKLRHVRGWLRAHDGGIVEVKTRGKVVDPDVVQRQLRGRGGTGYVVFVLRFGRGVEALIGRRVGRC